MGKTIDQLNLTDAPIRPAKPLDPRDTEWYRFSREIDDLLQGNRYDWAADTLNDIQLTVEKTERVTEGQRRAVSNIENARPSRGDGRSYSRRYEGHRR
jgi:hypothetical protein